MYSKDYGMHGMLFHIQCYIIMIHEHASYIQLTIILFHMARKKRNKSCLYFTYALK